MTVVEFRTWLKKVVRMDRKVSIESRNTLSFLKNSEGKRE